jgi:ABC-type polysaccharide/polyol phosphate export permease/tetratricopeptide (TPR) repeat protein
VRRVPSNISPISLDTPIDAIRGALAADVAAGLSDGDLLVASEVAYRNEDFAIAAQAMAILVARGGEDASHLCRLAQCSQVAGNTVDAETYFRRAIVADPSLSVAYHELRELLVRSGDFDGALDVARQHQIACGESPQLSVMIGSLLRARGDTREALAIFHRLNAVSEPPEQALRAEAELAYQMGLLEQAVAAATRARETYPETTANHLLLARILCSGRRFREVVPMLRNVAARDPANAEVHRLLSAALAETGRYQEALAAAGKAAELRPDASEYWYNASALANVLGHREQAIEWMARAVELDPGNSPLLVAQAHLLNGLGRLGQAIQVLRHAGQLFPDDSGIRDMRLTLQATALQREDGTGRLGPTTFKPLPRKSVGAAERREPERAIDELRDFIEAARVQTRVVMALVARDLSYRTMHSRLGLLSSFIEPLIQVVMLGLVLTVFNRGLPPLGNNLFFFYSTGVLPLYIVLHVVTHSLNIFREYTVLLMVPRIRRIDLLLAVAITELFIGGATTTLVYILFFAFGYGQGTPSIPTAIFAYLSSWLFGLGVGSIVAVLNNLSRSVEEAWKSCGRLLYFLSGVFFIPIMWPPWVRDILVWNPMLVNIEWFRTGFFPQYSSPLINKPYAVGVALAGLAVGLSLEQALRRRLRSL